MFWLGWLAFVAIIVLVVQIIVRLASMWIWLCLAAAIAYAIHWLVQVTRRDRDVDRRVTQSTAKPSLDVDDVGSSRDVVLASPLDIKVFDRPIDSFQAKLDLVRSTERELIGSFNYAGDHALDEFLDVLEQQIADHPSIHRVTLCVSSMFASTTQQRRMRDMQSRFASVLEWVWTDNWLSTRYGGVPISNHVKLLVRDGGAETIWGDAGVCDSYVRGRDQIENRSNASSMFNASLAAAHHSQDFVTRDAELGVVAWNVVDQLIRRWQSTDQKDALRFGQQQPRIESRWMSLWTSTIDYPDTSQKWVDALVGDLESAQRHIVVAHMYLHSDRIRDAIARAARANPSIRIQIISNACLPDSSPLVHSLFVPRSREWIEALRSAIPYPVTFDMEYYEWCAAPHTTYHKKLIVIDDETVWSGSSNLGRKGVELFSDDEINIVVRRHPTFANQVLATLERDMSESRRMTRDDMDRAKTWKQRASALMHRHVLDTWIG